MQTPSNPIDSNTDIINLIQSALLNFKRVSRDLRKNKAKAYKLSNLALYIILCLRNSKPLLRNDFMKRLNINYYDAGTAIDQLFNAALITKEERRENSNMKLITVHRMRYRLTLAGEVFIDDLINQLF